jgi:NADH-quinone oxidoreductase subunit J
MIDDNGIVIAFWVLSATTIGCALMIALVIRNLVHAVLFLALTFVGVAGLYVVLSADFVAVVQVLIYAGAVGVLMTFAIMLTPASDRTNSSTPFAWPAGVICLALFLLIAWVVGWETDWNVSDSDGLATTARALGEAFLKPYIVPFEIASVLLMTAMIGAIVLTREDADDA